MDFPAYLATMPMHAITEIHGEPGLLARFRLEIEAFDDAARDRLTEALELAAELHRDDRRVREPYLNHLLRVAIRMMHHYQVRDVDVIVAGLLHDAVEDHPAELAGPHAGEDPTAAALAALGERFGPRVARLVGAVTNPAYDPGRDPHVQYREHVAASLDREPWARVIKISDFTDNGVGVIHTVGPKVARSAAKYRPLVPVFRDLIARPDTPLSASVKRHIFAQLDLAEERFSAILDQPN
ncbi:MULTISPECIES: HD domain-containing protein [Micromonospora]|uniref:HD domain-containing protein n=1 Tax=Micromonospora solifontis TaxID=2487138 RepID=A0ABX9WBD7_9ACTN|nr:MULTISPECIES: HD domain-containing protein [Micromonospora]NES12991.1 HD domain-containing protein [Micromonospora sp. PPF5-17B]NES38632.1 HD domain-containing protein [Micromonospora solifontis]NES54916.1 HD domain-containing protein [Micromonospora sp. PPF5-6]RNL94445.1 HD domain-containing protein [Micromonospora solifontis]